MNGSRGIPGAYRDTDLGSAQHLAPQKQLSMLLNSMVERVRRAEVLLREGDIPGKAKAISSVFPLLEALRGSLDFDVGGDLAVNLASIYDTASVRLAEANAFNDAAKLGGVLDMLQPIAQAFGELPVPPTEVAIRDGTRHG